MNEKTKKVKVFWTADEQSAVVNKAAELYETDTEFTKQFLLKAQKIVLPTNRQRSTICQPMADRMIKSLVKIRSAVVTTTEEQVPEVIILDKEVTITPSRAELLASLTAEEKIRIVGEYFAQALLAVGQIPAILAKAQERVSFSEALSTVKAFKTETAPAVEKPTRVLMHSFLPGQEHDIRQKAKDFKLELVFTKNDSSRVETPASCSWCVMMRKTSHADYHKLKGGVGSDRLRVVDGITGAMKALADINSLVGTGVK